MRHFFTLIICCQSLLSVAKLWSGDTARFQFENKNIQLLDSTENNSSIFTPLANSHNTSWEFTISLDFSPSASNRLIVYLVTDTNSTEHINKSIFLQLGESGNEDAIELYFTENKKQTLLLRSKDFFSTSIDSLTIKVNHTSDNQWEILTKPNDESSFTSQGNVIFETALNTKYFGYSCIYTKTRATLFKLTKPIITRFEDDNIPPKINSVSYDNAEKILIQFSEPIISESIKISVNEILHTNIVKVTDTEYHLSFTDTKNDLEIEISNMIDYENNRGKDTSLFYHIISYHDLLFTEILYDPNEEQGEFVEIHNPTEYPIDLSNIAIARKTTNEYEQLIDLPPYILEPNTYIALTNYNNWFSPPLNSIDLKIPNLINDGATLYLLNSSFAIIDSVSYSDKLHSPFLKETKGISLIKNDKWTSSSTPTPGTKNYTSNLSIDEIEFNPQLLDLIRNPNEQITFRYNLEAESSANLFLLDRNGNLISQLINTKYIGTAGELFFNLESNTTQITTGVYVLLFEFWDLEGNKTIEKNVITIVKH